MVPQGCAEENTGVAARSGDGGGLRADARRNRAKVIAVARAVFAERGPEARMEEIAERAGVGVGTLYRNFPTKEALLGELLAESLRGIAAATRDALADPDPWAAFEGVMRLVVETGTADRTVERVMHRLVRGGAASGTGTRDARDALEEARDEFLRGLRALIERTQATRTLRPDITDDDVLLLFQGISRARPDRSTPEGRERCVRVILDGLRRWPERDPTT